MKEQGPTPKPKSTLVDSALAAGAATAVLRVVAVVQTVVVARALGPAEAGILGLSSLFVTLASIVTSTLETAALMGRAGSDEDYALVARRLRLAASMLVVLLGLGYVVLADHSSELKGVIALQMWLPLLEAAAARERVLLQRRLQVDVLTRATFIVGFVQFALFCLVLAGGLGVRALVAVQLISAALLYVQLRRAIPLGDGRWSRGVASEVARTAARINVGGLPQMLGTRTDNLMVAGTLGAAAMATYSISYGASRIPAQIIEWVAATVLLPKLAREAMRGPIRLAVGHAIDIGNALAPMAALALWFLAPLSLLVLGNRWTLVVPSLQTMAFGVLFLPVLYVFGTVLTATGRAHLLGISGIVTIVWQIIAIPWVANRWGLPGAAWVDVSSVALTATANGLLCQKNGQSVLFRGMTSSLLACLRSGLAALAGIAVMRLVPMSVLREIVGLATALAAFLILMFVTGGHLVLLELASSLARLMGRDRKTNTITPEVRSS